MDRQQLLNRLFLMLILKGREKALQEHLTPYGISMKDLERVWYQFPLTEQNWFWHFYHRNLDGWYQIKSKPVTPLMAYFKPPLQ